MRRSVVALALSTLATGACRFDLTEVEVSDEARLTIAMAPTLDGGLVLGASFHPGRTTDGSLRGVADDSLRLDGLGVPASEQRADGTRTYRVEWDPPPRPSTKFRFRGPAVEGLAEPPPEVGVAALRVLVPDTFVVSRAESIEIVIDGLGSGAPEWGIEGTGLVPDGAAFWSWSTRTILRRPRQLSMPRHHLKTTGFAFCAHLRTATGCISSSWSYRRSWLARHKPAEAFSCTALWLNETALV